jgi:hypothetical protein
VFSEWWEEVSGLHGSSFLATSPWLCDDDDEFSPYKREGHVYINRAFFSKMKTKDRKNGIHT